VRILATIAVCVGLIACHDDHDSQTSQPQPPSAVPNSPDLEVKPDGNSKEIDNEASSATMQEHAKNALTTLQDLDTDGNSFECTADNYQAHKPCQLTNLIYQPLKSADQSKTQIMIIDEGMEFPSLLRFKSRNLGVFQIGESGAIQERFHPGADTGIRVPNVIVDLFGKWDALGSSTIVPPGDEAGLLFDRLGAFFLESDLLGFNMAAHGNSLYFKLMELNPESEILTVQNAPEGGIFPWKKLRNANRDCLLDGEENEKIVREIFDNLSQSVLALVELHGIDYIQLTTGYNREVVLDKFPECRGAAYRSGVENFLRSYQSFEKSLGTIQGTVLVQSAWTSESLLFPEDVNSLEHADCNLHTNKVLAHPANFLPNFVVPKEGLAVNSQVPKGLVEASSLNLQHCGGFYVSIGKSRKGPRIKNDLPMGFTNTGLYFDDEYILSSSYIAPVLLSYLNYRRVTEHGSIGVDASLRKIQQKTIVEPLRYKQFLMVGE
jgi:hypothetical protein